MKNALFSFVLIGSLLALTGCCDDQPNPGKSNDRLSGRAGVNITSSNVSRVAPTARPDVAPAAN